MIDPVDKDILGFESQVPLELFASLVEHMTRWGDALEDSFGLCMLEVMQLDVISTRRFINDARESLSSWTFLLLKPC